MEEPIKIKQLIIDQVRNESLKISQNPSFKQNVENIQLLIYTDKKLSNCLKTGGIGDNGTKDVMEYLRNEGIFDLVIADGDEISRAVSDQRGGKSFDIKMSERSVEILEKISIYSLVKILRWKYYKFNEKKSLEAIMFKDYLATLIVATIFTSIRQEIMAVGLMIDQIISMVLYAKFSDDRVLLLPYYAIFL